MPALNFKADWADAVEAGALFANGMPLHGLYERWDELPELKRTTIRQRDDILPGRTLYLYTGMRTKQCRKLGEVLCLSKTKIVVHTDWVMLHDQVLTSEQWEYLARNDTAYQWTGDELRAFLQKTYGLPFHGSLIGW